MKHLLIYILLSCAFPIVGFGQQNFDKIQHDSIFNNLLKLMENDSLSLAKQKLDIYSDWARQNNDTLFLARCYNSYGNFFYVIKDYNTALNYYTLANGLIENDVTSINRALIYQKLKRYKSMDSIIKTIVGNPKITSRVFYTYEIKLLAFIENQQYDSVIALSKVFRQKLNTYNFNNSSKATEDNIKTELSTHFEMEEVFAMLEKNYPDHIVYPKLQALERNIKTKKRAEKNLSLSRFYKYKAQYYTHYKPVLDSSSFYSKLSRSYLNDHLESVQFKAGQNAKLIYDLVEKEEEYKRIALQNENKEVLLKSSKRLAYILSVLLFLVVLFSIYVYKMGRFRAKMNLALKKKNKQLIKVDNERTRFYSIISHELRTPLYTITGLNQLIKKEKNPKIIDGYFKNIDISSQHLVSLVNNILQLTRINIEKFELNKQRIQLSVVICNILETFKLESERKNIKFHYSGNTDTDYEILADKVKLSQIFINLISNAVKSTSNGNIWIYLNHVNETTNTIQIDFEIKDDGSGIPDQLKKTLFEDFKANNLDNNDGLGLGLYIVKELLKLYNSTISFTSKKDEGTSFRFSIVFEKYKTLKGGILEKEEKASLFGYNILVVDDNKINLMITKKTLEKLAANCDITDNGFNAIELVKNSTYHVILMDINMPKIDGYQTTMAIREFNKEIPIIALTAVDYQSVKEKAFSSGMNQIIPKPYKPDHLFEEIISHGGKYVEIVK